MVKKLNELVERLTKEQTVECARPTKTANALKESIDRGYVHITFKATGTEIGIQLVKRECNFSQGDFEHQKGFVRLVGALTLNYEKVKCTVDVQLSSCEGTGWLIPIDGSEYDTLMND